MEAFTQHMDVCTSIRHVLSEYPGDTNLFYELLQNADDAQATTATFIIDERPSSRSGPASDQVLSGPALLFYDDAVFQEQDYANLMHIGSAAPSTVFFRVQHGKTGKFGLGFNSIYHITDCPHFVSGGHCTFLDPGNICRPGGYRRPLSSGPPPADFQMLHGLCGLSLGAPHYSGTLFRFPLRTPASAASSPILKDPHDPTLAQSGAVTPEQLQALVTTFGGEAECAMLFLRNVKAVEFRHIPRTVSVPQLSAQSPAVRSDLLLRVALDSADVPEVSRQRRMLQQTLQGPQLAELLRAGGCFESMWKAAITIEGPSRPGRMSAPTRSEWWVMQRVGGGDASRRAVASQTSISGRPHVPLVPVAGAAFSLSLLQQPNPDSVFRGRAFCTLPLPVTTALPFHLNGFFALPSNRRTIWEGTHGPDADAKTAWNRGLYDVLVPAFLGLLREAKRQWPVAQYLRLWPVASPEQTPQYFSKWITRLYNDLFASGRESGEALVPPLYGPDWLSPAAACLVLEQEPADLLSLMDSVLRGMAQTTGPAAAGPALPKGLGALPSAVAQQVVHSVPASAVHVFSPFFVAKVLRSAQYRALLGTAKTRGVRGPVTDTPSVALVLRYLLRTATGLEHVVGLLNGVALCKVESGDVVCFGAQDVVVCTSVQQSQLLHKEQVLALDLNSQLGLDCITRPTAALEPLRVYPMCPAVLAKHLRSRFPASWSATRDPSVAWTPGEQGHPPRAYLHLVWQYLQSYAHADGAGKAECEAALQTLGDVPLVPTADGKLVRLRHAAGVFAAEEPSSKSAADGSRSSAAAPDGDDLSAVLTALSCDVLSAEFAAAGATLGRLGRPLARREPACIVAALTTLGPARVARAPVWARRAALRHVIVQSKTRPLDSERMQELAALPLFATLQGALVAIVQETGPTAVGPDAAEFALWLGPGPALLELPEGAEKLYKALGVRVWEFYQFFQYHGQGVVDACARDQQVCWERLLAFIRASFDAYQTHSKFMHVAFTHLQFIAAGPGAKPHRASHFYYPKTTTDADPAPPPSFLTDLVVLLPRAFVEWVPELQTLGLRTQIDFDLFVKCAAVAQQTQDLRAGQYLIEQLATSTDTILGSPPSSTRLSAVSKLCIAVSVEPSRLSKASDVLRVTDAHRELRQLRRLMDVVLPEDRVLTGRRQPYLFEDAAHPLPSSLRGMQELLSISSPTLLTVVENLKDLGSERVLNKDANIMINQVLAHLDDVSSSASDDETATIATVLKDCPCIPHQDRDAMKAFKPSSFVLDMGIPPLILTFPSTYPSLAAILKIPKGPTEEQLRAALASLAARFASPGSLPKPLLHPISVCLDQLWALKPGHKPFHVPTADLRMAPSDAVAVPDSPGLLSRVRAEALSLVHGDLSAEVLLALGVPALSAVLKRQLPVGVVPRPFEPLRQLSAQWTQTIQSAEFLLAILRLIAHELVQTASRSGDKGSGALEAAELEAILPRVQVRIVEDLPLRYIHTPTGRDITLSTAHAQSFADASSGSTVLYVMRAEFPDIMKKACTDALLDRLGNPALQTGALMACLGLPVASIHPMLSQFDIGEDTEICSRLQQLQSLREAVEARQKEESKAAATKPKKKGTSKAKEDRGKADAAPGPKANGVAASDGKAARKEQVVKKVAAPTGPAAGPVAANGKKWGTHEVTEPQGRQVTHHEEGPRGPVDPGRQKEYDALCITAVLNATKNGDASATESILQRGGEEQSVVHSCKVIPEKLLQRCKEKFGPRKATSLWFRNGTQTSPGAFRAASALANILDRLCWVFNVSPRQVNMVYDHDTQGVAFNRGAVLFFNARYYEMHQAPGNPAASTDPQVLLFWYVTFCHELAHNKSHGHDREHEQMMELLVVHFMPRFQRLYAPAPEAARRAAGAPPPAAPAATTAPVTASANAAETATSDADWGYEAYGHQDSAQGHWGWETWGSEASAYANGDASGYASGAWEWNQDSAAATASDWTASWSRTATEPAASPKAPSQHQNGTANGPSGSAVPAPAPTPQRPAASQAAPAPQAPSLRHHASMPNLRASEYSSSYAPAAGHRASLSAAHQPSYTAPYSRRGTGVANGW